MVRIRGRRGCISARVEVGGAARTGEVREESLAVRRLEWWGLAWEIERRSYAVRGCIGIFDLGRETLRGEMAMSEIER